MSSKKINFWDANTIADKVADKAFEHVLRPLQEALEEAMHKLYIAVVAEAGIDHDKALKYNVLKTYATPDLFVWGVYSDEDSLKMNLGALKGYKERRYIFEEMRCHDVMQNAGVIEAYLALRPIDKKRDELQAELRKQMQNKSVSRICKDWPEVAGFVQDFYNLDSPAPLTVPFESLIKRFLLALPAPEVQTAETV